MNDKSPTGARAARIAVLLPSLKGGGAERSMLNLIKGFLAQGRAVDLVLCQAKGAYLTEVPAGVNLIELEAVNGLRARWIVMKGNIQHFFALLRPVLLAKKVVPEIARIPSLQLYLKTHNPDVVLSAITYANLAVIWAKQISASNVPVVVSERIALSTYCSDPANSRKAKWRYLPELVKRTYPGADAVIAVSQAAADELVSSIGVSRESVTTIHNPVVDESLHANARQPLEHPWFTPGNVPVILAAGRLTEQKDFATLLRAFALVRAQRPVRLVILGEGRLRTELQQLANDLGVQADLDMPGFVGNPFQFMAHSSLLVLPSLYEGLPGVLIQALACGCPVVSTDCPGGSREILADGKYGALVAIGDVDAMADAIGETLDNPQDKAVLQHRSQDFSVDRAVDTYLKMLDAVVTRAEGRE
ncbi:N-acetylgalactosamine-N,N '-diacetylbacillosaminyl-diphospho-undecaprenol 4-alpha-N-acetylgalactosaminyltransferase [Halioglobus japonicus]|nr:N-acetylgalactosamine-N,N '-diacetylbacillosaminyl-diphospho-undecaprenol 4-alpha-N-acetylgalactosaminyltransferase [Halioglobus japonicus]